jgi:chromate transporter
VSSRPAVTFAEATRTWLRIGLLSFGGPAGQIAVMHRILVEEKKWIDEPRFLHALNYCMLLPGPEAQQLATYIGWSLHGIRGGLVAGTLFVLPGLFAIMGLSIAYVLWHRQPLIEGLFLGLKAAVIAVVIEALLRIARRALKTPLSRLLAAVAFVAIAALRLPFPAVILATALMGYIAARSAGAARADPVPVPVPVPAPPPVPGASHAIKLLAVWLPLWFAPVVLLALWPGAHPVFADSGVFFSKMAVVTFGGAYAALAYVAQQAVERFAWLSPVQMVDGLALAETTPGPLILVLQFVGFLAAYQAAGVENPLLAGVLGALLTVWVTFVPCFLWIFLGAPYVERLRSNHALGGALSAITAAVVGVIASLALWFALHVLFAEVVRRDFGGILSLELPVLSSLRLAPALLTTVALALMFVFRRGLGLTLLISALLGVLLTFTH